ncbi:hypothetical protein [Treponema pedis]|nr:hypothetical protein [Treponema pedis]
MRRYLSVFIICLLIAISFGCSQLKLTGSKTITSFSTEEIENLRDVQKTN